MANPDTESQYTFEQLAQYLDEVMRERGFSSQREFASHYDLPRRTLSRAMAGEPVSAKFLQSVASALKLPVDILYRLAGYLPSEAERSIFLDEVEGLLRSLDPSTQRRIRDLVREEVSKLGQQLDDEDASQTRAS